MGNVNQIMTQRQTFSEEDMLVSLTFHNFSADMIKEFAQEIVKPHFGGNMNAAVRALMEKAIREEKMVKQVIRKNPWFLFLCCYRFSLYLAEAP